MSIDTKELKALEEEWRQGDKSLKIEGTIKDRIVESITAASLPKLYPHEEVIMKGLLGVAEGILKAKKFTWPIFVDKDSGVVLDGMHRFTLLTDFCFKYVPVQLLDYQTNDDIILDVWCRNIMDVDVDEFNHLASKLNMEEVNMSWNQLKERKEAIVISPENKFLKFADKYESKDEYYKLKELEMHLGMPKKYTIGRAEYGVEEEMQNVMDIPDSVTMFPRCLTKREVVEVATRGEVFPPKTTRHIFPYRVYNIDIRPSDLQDAASLEELASKIQNENQNRELYYIGRGITIDRYYGEHMFKFE
jgi:hypothetical protein